MRKEMFNHEITILRDTYRRLLRRNAKINLIKLTGKTHPADLAEVFRHFSTEEQIEIFSLMKENEHAAEFLVELDDALVIELLEKENFDRIASIIKKAPTNDQSGILNILGDEKAQSIIELLNAEEQEEIAEIMGYPDDSAGTLMNTEVFTLHESITAGDAIKTLQDQEGAEMVFYLYITDDDDRLVGVISLRALTTTPSSTKLKDIMIKNIHSIRPETDQEDVAKIVAQYNFLAVPVLDSDSKLLGIVTVDDVVDVIREDADQNLLGMAGVAEDTFAPPGRAAKSRVFWLSMNLVTAFIAASAINLFQDALDKIVYLAVLMPIVASMGGVAATQTLTIVLRGLTLEQINTSNIRWLFKRELAVSIINGIILSILVGTSTYLWFQDKMLAILISCALVINLVSSVIAGILVPLVLRKFNQDPAIGGSVVVTTFTDVIGFISFLGLATLYLI